MQQKKSPLVKQLIGTIIVMALATLLIFKYNNWGVFQKDSQENGSKQPQNENTTTSSNYQKINTAGQ